MMLRLCTVLYTIYLKHGGSSGKVNNYRAVSHYYSYFFITIIGYALLRSTAHSMRSYCCFVGFQEAVVWGTLPV